MPKTETTFTNPSGHALSTTVTVTNIVTGKTRQAVIPCTYMNGPQIHSYLNGRPVDLAFPLLTAMEKHFISTGLTGAEQLAGQRAPYVFDDIRFDIVDK